jgi:tRNA nucleotidyltransferase/poly(A) polymerase
MKKTINIPQIVQDIAEVLVKNGNQAFVVGGAVRDAVMGQDSKDIDIATDLFVDDVIELLKDQPFTDEIKKTGDKFPVARIFTKDGNEFEIATFRADSGEGKDTDFEVVSTIEGDVARRDFTFNALFANALNGQIIDLVGGLQDLENGIVRFMGDPVKRIKEDRTRLLRMVRFAERFGFKIPPGDLELIKENNILIEGLDEKDQVKKEMIVTEMTKGLDQAKDKVSFMNALLDLGLLEQCFPGLKIGRPHVKGWQIERMLVQILWNNDPKTVSKVLHDMKWSTKVIDRVECFLTIKDHDLRSDDFKGLARFVKKLKACEALACFDEFFVTVMFTEERKRFAWALLNFKLMVKREDFPKIPDGPELGKAIHDKEMSRLKTIARL